jgi:hypothetical protein
MISLTCEKQRVEWLLPGAGEGERRYWSKDAKVQVNRGIGSKELVYKMVTTVNNNVSYV